MAEWMNLRKWRPSSSKGAQQSVTAIRRRTEARKAAQLNSSAELAGWMALGLKEWKNWQARRAWFRRLLLKLAGGRLPSPARFPSSSKALQSLLADLESLEWNGRAASLKRTPTATTTTATERRLRCRAAKRNHDWLALTSEKGKELKKHQPICSI